jgi:EmrB/QacA subfamily drug resistance transporter
MTPASMTPRRKESRRWLALGAVCTGTLMTALDATVVNVALPTIQQDLHVSAASLAWVVNAYLISFGGLLLLAGRLGDLLGRRTCFLIGLGVFTGASLMCGLASGEGVLVAGRFIQGLGGGMTASVALSIVVSMFPEPHDQARAIGIFAFVTSAGGAIGLLVGGLLTQFLDWHWIFLVNPPVGLLTAALAIRFVHRDVGIGLSGGVDLLGGLLITAALTLGVYAIVGPAAELGWGAQRTLAAAALAAVLLAAFVLRQATARTPLMSLRLLRVPNVAAANLIQLLSVAGMFGLFFLGALYLRRILGYDALQIGLAFLPVTVSLAVSSIACSERTIARFGARTTVVLGLSLMAGGLAFFARSPITGGFLADVLPVMVLMGAGAGLCFPALMGLAMSGATSDSGVISGLVATTAQMGGALGLAVLATLSTSRTVGLRENGVPMDLALISGYHLAFWVAAGLVAAAIAIAMTALHPTPRSASGAQHATRATVHVGGAVFVHAGTPAGHHGEAATRPQLDPPVGRRRRRGRNGLRRGQRRPPWSWTRPPG